jgi:hypothetical protein
MRDTIDMMVSPEIEWVTDVVGHRLGLVGNEPAFVIKSDTLDFKGRTYFIEGLDRRAVERAVEASMNGDCSIVDSFTLIENSNG